ncbi:MAG: glycosyltransferase family 4 protein [Actinomycetes bacterium]
MRVGLVCPYSWDVPGGVQFHVRDLAEALLGLGHEVSVIAPADDETPLPGYVVPAGRAVPVPYNGSVARVSFGLVTNARVRRWVREGRFDVLHLHEPTTPSLSLLALWAAEGPIVGTFHTSNERSRVMAAAYPFLMPGLEKLSARIAVSEDARRTLVDHFGGDAVVIPNGVYVDRFATAAPRAEWQGTGGTICFLGRLDEPRKGLPVLVAALPRLVAARPGLRVLVAGPGDAEEELAEVSDEVRRRVLVLGQVDEQQKAQMLASADVYVAPHTGGESFGIVLAEAMAARAAVVASDLEAFRRVLDAGRAGVLFPVGDPAGLADAVLGLLADPQRRAGIVARATGWVAGYDWSRVAGLVVAVYDTVTFGASAVAERPARGSVRGSVPT